MGQTVTVNDVKTIGETLIIATDRSFTGQDGSVVAPDSPRVGVPGLLADSLYQLGLGIDHLFVQQNTVTVRRPGGWDRGSADKVTEVTASFLRFYDEEE